MEYQEQKRGSSTGVASLVTGIIGLLFFGIILGCVTLVLAAANKDEKQRGFATAGKVLGIIDIVGGIITIFLLAK